MADSQVPWGIVALNGTVTEAAWWEQAELVPNRRGRQDDSARRARTHVEARRLNSCANAW
jgi:hypothetical protein